MHVPVPCTHANDLELPLKNAIDFSSPGTGANDGGASGEAIVVAEPVWLSFREDRPSKECFWIPSLSQFAADLPHTNDLRFASSSDNGLRLTRS